MVAKRGTKFTRSSSYGALLLAPLLAATLLGGCEHNIYPDFDPPIVCSTRAAIDRSIFFIGDAGAPALPDPVPASPDALVDPVLLALQRDVAKQVAALGAERTAVIVLGDNIYPSGLDLPGEPGRAQGIRVLEAQIAAIGDAQGMFVLGNHDWDQAKDHGWKHARAQHDYLAARAPNISVHPPDICPGPEAINFSDDLRFVFFDFWSAIYQMDHPDGPSHTASPERAMEGSFP